MVTATCIRLSEPAPTDLLGCWDLERRVVDRRLRQFGRVSGLLELILVGSDVLWLELGEMAWNGNVIEVTRELHIVQSDGTWAVRFSGGGLFHSWSPGEIVSHPCDEDLYRGLIKVDCARTRMRVLWDVSGPTKDQRIITRCVRLD